MKLSDILFSVNSYDQDGDINATGIFLHFGEVSVKVAENLDDFIKVAERITGMIEEIKDNYLVKCV